MAGNSFGEILRLSTFGESHGPAMGGVLDGVPAGIWMDLEEVQRALDRRRPGQNALTTERKEQDEVRFLSGFHPEADAKGKRQTLGSSIGFIIENTDQRSKDYQAIHDQYRPSHADYTYEAKYGLRDHRGGGRSSARETVCRVVAGALAAQLLPADLRIMPFVERMAGIGIPAEARFDPKNASLHITGCPHPETAQQMQAALESLKTEGDSAGGVIACRVDGVPAGWGEPVFDKLSARLAYALMGINAAKGIEFGSGFSGADSRGSIQNDPFIATGQTSSNHSGGIQGGISNGMPILFRLAFKPIASIKQSQQTVNRQGDSVAIQIEGRHDPAVLPRAVPIVEAMVALVLADFSLAQRIQQISK
ncbi:MAG: chorismate synthase [Schleiferiaceae bacterium]|nr:chorismate synthase [Schleiferiaceae bacterium]